MVARVHDRVTLAGSVSRRDALRWAAATLAVSAAGALWSRHVGVGSLSSSVHSLRLDLFTTHLGEVFHVGSGGLEGLSFTLEQVRDLWTTSRRANLGEERPEYFSLLFAGPMDAPVNQGSYQLLHPTMGTLWLFIVPMAAEGQRRLYEAVVNQQRPTNE